ncbi:hypothetical protein ACP8Z1_25095 [Escherichia coli]
MTSLKTSIKTITYLSDIGCLEIQGASLLMQLVGYWYENREMQDAVPDFFYTGLRMYRFHPGT